MCEEIAGVHKDLTDESVEFRNGKLVINEEYEWDPSFLDCPHVHGYTGRIPTMIQRVCAMHPHIAEAGRKFGAKPVPPQRPCSAT